MAGKQSSRNQRAQFRRGVHAGTAQPSSSLPPPACSLRLHVHADDAFFGDGFGVQAGAVEDLEHARCSRAARRRGIPDAFLLADFDQALEQVGAQPLRCQSSATTKAISAARLAGLVM